MNAEKIRNILFRNVKSLFRDVLSYAAGTASNQEWAVLLMMDSGLALVVWLAVIIFVL